MEALLQQLLGDVVPRYGGHDLPAGEQVDQLAWLAPVFADQRTLLQRRQFYSDDYVTQRLLVSYPVTPRLTAQLNVSNLFDEDYYTAIRNNVNATTGVITGGWATPGEAREATLSLYYSF